jgi:hypothetical protein
MRIFSVYMVFCITLFYCVLAVESESTQKIDFWDQQRKGANFFNKVPTLERFEAGSELGLDFIRLAPDKWDTGDRDFLIGNADKYEAISERDFGRLRKTLDDANKSGLKVVLTMLSLPGARWSQNNNDKDDPRLWSNEHYQKQAEIFWKDLAEQLRDHPAVVAYDPLNEPHPARALIDLDDVGSAAFSKWIAESKGTVADLNRFNRRIVTAIRQVDATTPIMLETYSYSSPEGFRFLEPIDDDRILYSFHVYEPWNYTTQRVNKGRFAYPDRMPVGWSGEVEKWTLANLHQIVDPVITWCKIHNIPANRIAVSEFGCNREVAGAQQYLADLIGIFNQQKWHWAFYSYREDTWTGMDYELGTGKLGWEYWKAVEAGKEPEKPRHENPLFNVIRREFK